MDKKGEKVKQLILKHGIKCIKVDIVKDNSLTLEQYIGDIDVLELTLNNNTIITLDCLEIDIEHKEVNQV